MGTVLFETRDAPGTVLMKEMAPYNIRMWTTDHEAAALSVVVPVDDENAESLRKVYDGRLIPGDRVYMGFIVKHEGTLCADREWRQPRTVSIKIMTETMGPCFTGGGTPALLRTLTPLRTLTEDANMSLQSAHAWRERTFGRLQQAC